MHVLIRAKDAQGKLGGRRSRKKRSWDCGFGLGGYATRSRVEVQQRSCKQMGCSFNPPFSSRGWWFPAVCVGAPCSLLDSCLAFPLEAWEVPSAVEYKRHPLLGWAVGLRWGLCLSPLVEWVVGGQGCHLVSVIGPGFGGRDMGPWKVVWVPSGCFHPCYGCCVHRRWMIHLPLPQPEVWFPAPLAQQTDYALLACRGWARRLRYDHAVLNVRPAVLPSL
jgi:hypothetical protein